MLVEQEACSSEEVNGPAAGAAEVVERGVRCDSLSALQRCASCLPPNNVAYPL